MRDGTPSLTAELAAMVRALAQYSDRLKGIVNDPYAKLFCGARVIPALLINIVVILFDRSLRHIPFRMLRVGLLCAIVRHRYIEDTIQELCQHASQNLIVLGAGYDTKSIRLKSNAIKIIELDHPSTQKRKIAIFKKYHIDIQATQFVSCDLTKYKVTDCIDNQSIDSTRPLIVMAEGLLSYFTPERIQELLCDIASLSKNVTVLFDYRHKDIHGSRDAQSWYRNFKKKGEKYLGLFSSDEMDILLVKAGFNTDVKIDLASLGSKYGLVECVNDLKGISEMRVISKCQ